MEDKRSGENVGGFDDELLEFVPPRRKPKKVNLSQPMEKELETAETTEWFVKMEPEEEKAKRLAREKNQPLVIAVVVLVFLIIAVGIIGYSLVESGFRF